MFGAEGTALYPIVYSPSAGLHSHEVAICTFCLRAVAYFNTHQGALVQDCCCQAVITIVREAVITILSNQGILLRGNLFAGIDG